MTFPESFADSPADLRWQSQDGSTRILIPESLVDQIAGYVIDAYKSIPRRGAEAGGLLTGEVKLGPITEILIKGFEPVHCDYRFGPSFILPNGGRAEFHSVMTRYPNHQILGYYRSNTRPDFGPQNSDREIIEHAFPGLSGLILLIKPSGGLNLLGNYFFFERGRLQAGVAGPEFQFAGSTPGGTPPSPVETEPSAGQALPRKPLPEIADAVESSDRRKSLQWEIVAAGLMIAAALGLLWWQYRGTNGEQEAAPAQLSPAHVASLGLAVQPGQGSWRITWDSNSPAAQDAVRGILDVTATTSHDRIPLTAAQVRGGTATYLPTGDDIAFRLELFGRGNGVSSETYRVLLEPREGPASAPSVPSAKPMPKPEAPAAEPAAAPYVEPQVVTRVAPEVPEGIRSRITSPQGIDVRVSIDREGHVTGARAVQHEDGLINFLGDRAVAAARQWTFTPAKRGNIPVASTQVIHFVFEH